MTNKKIIENQNYEDYWKLTLEYSDINSEKYNNTLKIIVNFIDNNIISENKKIFEKQYKELQEKINAIYHKKDMASIRKSINQFIKLGFIEYRLKGYHKKTKSFLNVSGEKKKNLFSEILYSSASFKSSVTNYSEEKEINFFIKTLEKNNFLTDDDVLALITTTPSNHSKGYLTRKELNAQINFVKAIKFKERKYNQLAYIIDILKKLDGVCYKNNKFYLEDTNIEDSKKESTKKVRDNYLQRLYKNQLKQESIELFGDTVCMISKVPYYAMIASHIKPFIKATSSEEYDSQNGLLLGKDLDFLFDQGYISIDDNGKIIFYKNIRKEIVEYHHLQDLYIDSRLLTHERKEYLKYHREFILKK